MAQWQVSTDGGSTWTNDASDTPGSSVSGNTTTATLTLAVSASSADRYRAVFSNSVSNPTATPPGPYTISSVPTGSIAPPPSNAPTVTGVSPSRGGAFSRVLIRGTKFQIVRSVRFGAGHPARFVPLSSRRILALAPPERSGAVDVTVTTRDGTSAPSRADQFTYR